MYILDIRKQNRLPTVFLLNVKRFQHSSDFTKNTNLGGVGTYIYHGYTIIY